MKFCEVMLYILNKKIFGLFIVATEYGQNSHDIIFPQGCVFLFFGTVG